jgi:hypothetical protein
MEWKEELNEKSDYYRHRLSNDRSRDEPNLRKTNYSFKILGRTHSEYKSKLKDNTKNILGKYIANTTLAQYGFVFLIISALLP